MKIIKLFTCILLILLAFISLKAQEKSEFVLSPGTSISSGEILKIEYTGKYTISYWRRDRMDAGSSIEWRNVDKYGYYYSSKTTIEDQLIDLGEYTYYIYFSNRVAVELYVPPRVLAAYSPIQPPGNRHELAAELLSCSRPKPTV